MFKSKTECSVCRKEIKGNDVVYVKVRYPLHKGMTEITAYLKNEGTVICEDCYEDNTKTKGTLYFESPLAE